MLQQITLLNTNDENEEFIQQKDLLKNMLTYFVSD